MFVKIVVLWYDYVVGYFGFIMYVPCTHFLRNCEDTC